ncbi:hypothetical protein [Psychromarinibacter halotolerans]|uniref:Uncharacterized protein n=1 Tax=Psychromarinibacter halotolerans TaxID=1775175 RepID=A0ABV7GS12_9RHOB|nr:hypothetical protein [Psychromarinibacter halotolerans]MDF0596707.1 hypothetical protein [Psychromarinibacter halotolerans]
MTPDHAKALDLLSTGQWQAAHDIVEHEGDTTSAWIHALVHRIEGDDWNAGYWYRRAGRAPFDGTVDQEIAAIRSDLAD